MIGEKVTGKIVKSKLVPEAYLRYNTEILISPETEKTRNNKGIEVSIKK